MKSSRSYGWIVAVSAIVMMVALSAYMLYLVFPEKIQLFINIIESNSGAALFIALIGLVGLILAADLLYRMVFAPLKRMIEETALIGSVNYRHRINVQGGLFFGRLAKAINAVAGRIEAIQQYDQKKIKSIKAVIEKERNMLAGIMAELTEGVIVCNLHGSILLYNQQAKYYLAQTVAASVGDEDAQHQYTPIGLGRSIYSILDKNQLQHALDDITAKLDAGRKNVAAHFVALGRGDALLRVEVVSVLDEQEAFAGFILILQDITRHLQTAGRMEGTLNDLARAIRTSSASIRATIEAILEYPEMDRAQLDRFRDIIHKESVTMSAISAQLEKGGCPRRDTEWPLVNMSADDLLALVRQRAEEATVIGISFESSDRTYGIAADAYALSLALLFVLTRVQKQIGVDRFSGLVERKEAFIHIDFSWVGAPVKVDMLRQWDGQSLHVGQSRLPFTLKEILRYHGAEICPFAEPDGRERSGMRLFLPACDPLSEKELVRRVAILPQSRPEFFDFDLFGHAEPRPFEAQRRLTQLMYTVFDTETTGLDPSGGDEIIAIGAVRIVNGRLLQEERFEQLIDPHRSVPQSSTRIHGIRAEMLKDRPDIDTVLPQFHRFAARTILVGHNVAFDMRLLQVKEKSTGIQFTNPVLDTLLLSAVVHPAQSDHTIEAIAERLGVPIEGRHTAMGDAVATAKMFLKLVPLLEEKGITTLQEAVTASQKTFYARIKY